MKFEEEEVQRTKAVYRKIKVELFVYSEVAVDEVVVEKRRKDMVDVGRQGKEEERNLEEGEKMNAAEAAEVLDSFHRSAAAAAV